MKKKIYEVPTMALRVVVLEEGICIGSKDVNTGKDGNGGTNAGDQNDHGTITPDWENL